MNELKIFVERCVRPVIRDESAKLQMRRELYAHVRETYEQELVRAENNGQVALEQTLQRMGDSQQLTQELQDSVGTLDRWEGHLDALMHRPAEVPLLRYALRITFYFGGAFIGLLLLLLALRLPELFARGNWAVAELRFVGSLGLVWLANLFTYSLIYGRVVRFFEQGDWTLGRAATVALLAVTAAVDVLISGWLFTFLVSGSADFTQQVLPYWGILAGVGAVAIVFVSWFGVAQLRGLKEWRDLEIDA